MPGPWVLISPAGVRHLIKDRSEAIEFAGESEQKALKMTSSNLLGYLGESNSSTASKKPAQHIIPDDDAEMSNSSVDSGVGSWRL